MATGKIRSRPITPVGPLGPAPTPAAPRSRPDSFSRVSTRSLEGIVQAGSGVPGAARFLARDPGEAIVRDVGVRNMESNVADRPRTVMRIVAHLGGAA